ncbi:uncharacterized protein LOC109721937 [Ananas comosus]|uniref:Uncharacterized protein LOC109721937 n=1 Tax=Ananas comosus TaxID=4615 RepID=A0A6P5GB20_ANACO|nr:uncharacterized protein LOC109721937 [Ananas comosus]
MGDHFVLLVDRLITESTLEAAIESRNKALVGSSAPASTPQSESTVNKEKNGGGIGDGIRLTGKLAECRICQEEDDQANLETPCSCCGSLKFAHRKCVQRWCNEMGGTTCEICLQQFQPNYTAPPKLLIYGRIPLNFRENLQRQQIYNLRYIPSNSTERDVVGSSTDDYSASNARRSIMYCRSVAVMFMFFLVLRDALPIIFSGAELYSLALFSFVLLRTAGLVLPLYVMLRAITAFHRRQYQRQVINEPTTSENEGPDSLQQPSQPLPPQHHIIHVQ